MLMGLVRFVSTHPLTRRRKAAAMARVLLWQVRSRLQDELAVPWIGGLRLIAKRGMNGLTGNIYVGLHEFADMGLLLHLLREGDLFFDVGANVGSYTLLASGVCKARTFAFEPDPESMARLRKNLEANALASRVRLLQTAVGAGEGEVSFTVGRDSENKVADGTAGEVRSVKVTTLDAAAGDEVPLLIKIDVEGYEPEVIKGATRLLGDPRLKVLECETVTPAMEQVLSNAGFEKRYYDPLTRVLANEPQAMKASNTLFVRDEAFVRSRIQSAPKFTVVGETF